MKHQRHFESATASRDALQIGELIADLDCIVQILNSDIVAEEERAHAFKRSQPEYPMLARTLAARRGYHCRAPTPARSDLPRSVRRSLGLALLVPDEP
jgi:hypothetical protein